MLQDCVFCGGQRNLMDYIWLALPYRISKITMLFFFTPVLGIEIQEIRFCDFKDFDIILCQFKKQSFHSILCIFQNKQKMGSLKANLHIYITISTITSVCPSVRFPVSVKKICFRLNRLGIIPWLLGSTPGVNPGYPQGTQPLRRS